MAVGMAYPRANIEPDLLKWAREKAGYGTATAARKVGVKEERLIAWEDVGNAIQPTINQLRKAANVYKVPVSVLYLSERPMTFQPMRDLRRLPGEGLRSFSPGLIREMELARQKRNLAIELAEDIGGSPFLFTPKAKLQESAETVGNRIRTALKVSHSTQVRWRDPRIGFNEWRRRIEGLGVMVLQMTSVESSEASGFALAEHHYPVIAVNRKDVFARRTFSLLHELAHLMLRVSGASDLDIDAARPPEDQEIEIFCNRVAADALMPRDLFLVEDLVEVHGPDREWRDDELSELASRYSVSREAVVRRLMTFGRTTVPFYRQKRAQYRDEYERQKARAKERYRAGEKDFKTNPARDAVLENGMPFVRLVIDNYHLDHITLSEASGYLGVKVRHVLKIEENVRGT